MSGFEVAGLVLGVFPLLQDTAKGLRNVFIDVKTWWRFETEFEALISTIEMEHIKYSQNLEFLLADLEIPEEDRNRLQKDPNCTLWHDLKVQVLLRQRVQDRYYDWFTRQLQAINTALSSLQEILTSGKVYHLDTMSLESEMFRLKTSFSHEKDHLIAKIATVNKDIYEFLERASHVPSTKPSQTRGTQSRPPINVKHTAEVLFQCFQKQLKCECKSTHACGVTVSKLENEHNRNTVCINMVFQEGTRRTRVNIQSIMETARNKEEAVQSNLEDVTKLKQELSARNRMVDVRKKGPKSIIALASSSIPTFHSFSRKSQKSSPGDPESKRRSSLRLRLTSIATRTKQQPPREVDQTQPVTIPRGVRFADDDDSSLSQPTDDVAAIRDLCSAITKKPSVPSLGYLESNLQSKILLNLDPVDQELFQHYTIETVEAFLDTTPRRDTRIRVGYALALAIINLGGSPWIPQSWNKRDVFLVRDPESPVPQPYLNHASLRQTLLETRRDSAAQKARSTLFALGVLLLELVFREKLENQPFRVKMMGTDGKPNEETDFATALLWQQRVEDEFGDELADAIKRCLVCMFDLAPAPDLRNSDFVKAVWQQVLLPVDKFLSAWGRS